MCYHKFISNNKKAAKYDKWFGKLTADPRRSEQPPKQDVDFLSGGGR